MDSFMDQYRTGPETLGGRYLRMFCVKLHPVKTDIGKNYEELSKTYYGIVNR